jgi:hypothetical protein
MQLTMFQPVKSCTAPARTVMETRDQLNGKRTKTVTITAEAYDDLQRSRDRDRRQRLLAELDREALESNGEPRELTDEELEDVAVELGKEINQRVTQRLFAEAWRNKRSGTD